MAENTSSIENNSSEDNHKENNPSNDDIPNGNDAPTTEADTLSANSTDPPAVHEEGFVVVDINGQQSKAQEGDYPYSYTLTVLLTYKKMAQSPKVMEYQLSNQQSLRRQNNVSPMLLPLAEREVIQS
jgi:hypothetical protein